MAPLAALTSLRVLWLEHINHLPACLSALAWLEQLDVGMAEEPSEGGINAALPSLHSLTCLSLFRFDNQRMPPALAQLPRLQRLSFDGWPDFDVDLSLPQGPWLASIRWLGLPWEVLEPALSALASAPHLEYLCAIFGTAPPALPEAHPLWAFAATHPPLRCLGIQAADPTDPFTPEAAAALRLRRPGLRWRYLEGGDFKGELLGCETIPEDETYPSEPYNTTGSTV